ncbi:Z1 domain-containing protein [Roseimicrobium gellanilyticum]|uniref:Z1 domain-containing protein n=1 Tax=Roseimicrobium gellanilyticum TaxID=748857 RepID=A0A366HNY9_9BACT|nr:Z1 domain-containing protein [Roseimicrobium gellanilyticum]RBP45216.1 Z1 domain-containing protein [Roseimicrobium gellanilyticum]
MPDIPPLETNGAFYPAFTGPKDYPPEQKSCIEETVGKLISTATTSDQPGMLLGKIQSGKTKTFMGIIALAFDNGFDVCVVLTKGTKALAKQTFERLDQEFAEFVSDNLLLVYDIMSLPKLSRWEQGRKLVFVVKKQSDNLDRLHAALVTDYPELGRKRVLIVDDEADFASIGYSRSSRDGMQLRKIAKQINDLRTALSQPSFLQVTATPYSLYLQPDEIQIRTEVFKPVRPAFTKLVPVHPAYVGGDVYFPEEDSEDSRPADFIHVEVSEKEMTVLKKKDRRVFDPRTDALTSKAITSFRRAIVTFITGAAIRQIQSRHAGVRPANYSFLVHTEAAKGSHAWQEELVEELMSQLVAAAGVEAPELLELIDAACDDLGQSILLAGHHLPAKEAVRAEVLTALRDEYLLITKVNSDEQVMDLLDRSGQLRLRAPMNIFIGGQILDRGITIANLIGFFYGRNPKRFQQDTVLQHSRMYGFRPREDVAVTRFYTAATTYDAMRRMQESDNALRRALEAPGDQSVIFIQKASDGTVVPCSPNKILLSNVATVRPHKRLLPVGFQSGYKTRISAVILRIDSILAGHWQASSPEAPFTVPLAVALEVVELAYSALEFEEPGYSSNKDELIGALAYLSQNSQEPSERGLVWVIWRGEREVVRIRPSGRFTNAPDSQHREGKIAREVATHIPALLMLRQQGREEQGQGWRGTPFYWPVVLTPGDTKTAIFANEVRPDALEGDEGAED